MTVKEAADIIGCSPSHVRTLLQRGILKGRKKPSTSNQYGHEWVINEAEATRYRDSDQSRGWPRGRSRK